LKAVSNEKRVNTVRQTIPAANGNRIVGEFRIQNRRDPHRFTPGIATVRCRLRDGNLSGNMRRFIACIALLQFAATPAFARQQSPVEQSKRDQSLLARVTVYWARGGGGSDRYTRQHKCSTGLRLQTGHCAVDPNQIPYGSRLIFPDGTALAAVDTGTAVKNRKAARKSGRTIHERNAIVIDRFFETKNQALSWANRNPPFLTVRVVPPNQHIATQISAQPLPRSGTIAGTTSVVTKPKTVAPLIASSTSISRNPFNKLGR
jgi:3D (Asp-Asp-Asp) domain-containing protein